MRLVLPVIFQKRLFISLSLVFIAFATIGTLLHEGGHYIMSRYYGHKNAHINYATTFYGPCAANDTLLAMWRRNSFAIEHKQPYAESGRYEGLEKLLRQQAFMMALGGPLQTMLTGSIGFILILVYRKSYKQAGALKVWQWLLVFLALFWMRQAFNLITAILIFIMKSSYGHGDETGLSIALGLPPFTGYIITGTIALILLMFILFMFIPIRQRFTFLMAGIVGGIGGSLLWLQLLGPLVMP